MRVNGRRNASSAPYPVLVRLTDPEFRHARGARHTDCPERFVYDPDTSTIIRILRLKDGTEKVSSLLARLVGGGRNPSQVRLAAAYDYAWLRMGRPPPAGSIGKPIRCVDLFSGLGGMSLGVEEAARALDRPFELVWAADSYDHARNALTSYHRPLRGVTRHPIERLINGSLGSPLTVREKALKAALGPIDYLVGGPPCQGHSDLNNHTRRSDPKNELYLRMARATEVLEPRHVIIENVPGVEKDNGQVMYRAWQYIENLYKRSGVKYSVDAAVLRAEHLGVAQTRHRMFLVASQETDVHLDRIVEIMRVPPRPFEWACGDLKVGPDPFDRPARPTTRTSRRIDWLFDENKHNLPNAMRPECHQKPHRYTSVYGRMWKGKPASTMTTGFMVMGQGRFVHPHERRTLTPHEGARLQFLPDWIQVPERRRKDYALLIGNAVPPKVTMTVVIGLETSVRP
jgi:DNA (cytosine-5)-methyltransferase 1